MNRIFASLASLSTLLLIAAFILGLSIDDAKSPSAEVQSWVSLHFLTAVGALVFALLVHAIMLTYFMGTGRWMEETSRAYGLSEQWLSESHSLKYRAIPVMAGCVVMLIVTGAFGAAADPATPYGADGWFGLSAATGHLLMASTMLCTNVFVNLWEYQAIHRNGEIVEAVLGEVRRIREEKGLPV